MPSNQAKAVSELEWDQHKDEIIQHFLTGKMETLRQKMEDRGFSATKSQYEARLRKWGVRKNGTKDDWKSIGRLVRIREQEGKRTDVYMNGKHIPAAKAKRQISRYLTTLELNNFAEAPHPQIPDGFLVETPKEETSLHFPPTEAEITLPIRQIMTANLPSSILHQFLVSRGCSFTLGSPHGQECIDPRVLSNRSPWCPDREQVSAVTDARPNLYNNALQLISEFQNGTFSNLHPLVSSLRSLLPSVAVRDFEGCPNLTLNREFVNSALTRLIISSTANNFAGLDGLPRNILECLRNPTNMRLLQELQSANGPEAEAFVENFFCAAVESSNAGIVEYLLRTNDLDPNKLVCNQRQRQYTPIERAVKLDSMEVTRVLIHAKADLNKTAGSLYDDQGTLEVAIERQSWIYHRDRPYVNLELVRMLLEAGAILNPEGAPVFHNRFETGLVVLLITFYFNASTTRHIAIKLLEHVLRTSLEDGRLRWEKRDHWDFVRNFIIGIAQSDFITAINILDDANINLALNIAAEQGNLELVTALLRSGTTPTADVLSLGIKSGNRELVRFLLDEGADASGHPNTATIINTGPDNDYDWTLYWDTRRVSRRCYMTPLAEAIRLGNAQILELLQSRGAWLRIEEKSRFSAALAAATEVGNISLVRKLLDIRSVYELLNMEPILDGHELLDPLLASVLENQPEIFMMILDSGATAIRSKVTEIMEPYERDPGSANIKKSPIQQALVHAARAGYVTIVRKLLSLTSMFGGLYLHDPLLASIEGNHEQVVLMLLDSGADPSSKCIAAALDNKNFELAHLLLEADANVKTLHSTCLFGSSSCTHPPLVLKATNLGAYSIVERIVAQGADVEESCLEHDPGTALIVAVRKQDIKLVQLLLDSGATVNSRGRSYEAVTPLAAAVMQGDVTMTDFLLTRGANPADAKALYEGMLGSNVLTKRLLEAFTKQYPHGKKGFGPGVLRRAIELGNLDIIRQLLLLPLDLDGFSGANSSSRQHMTPLGWAIMKDQGEHLDIVQVILEAGGDPNSTVLRQEVYDSEYGTRIILKTALLVAVETSNLLMVHLLIHHRANVNCPTTMGVKRTPLQSAAEIGSFDIVECLLSKDAEINALPARSGGATALQLAAIGGYTGIAELLLNSGADPNAPAAKVSGRTAIEGAAEYGRVDMLRLLTNAGAKMDWRQFERAARLAERNGHVATKKYLESLFHETVSVEELLS